MSDYIINAAEAQAQLRKTTEEHVEMQLKIINERIKDAISVNKGFIVVGESDLSKETSLKLTELGYKVESRGGGHDVRTSETFPTNIVISFGG